jgi:hypothetical protein
MAGGGPAGDNPNVSVRAAGPGRVITNEEFANSIIVDSKGRQVICLDGRFDGAASVSLLDPVSGRICLMLRVVDGKPVINMNGKTVVSHPQR